MPIQSMKGDTVTTSKWEIIEFNRYYYCYMAYFVVGNVDSMVSCAFVILTFPFANTWYSCMCGCAHSQCMRLWLRKRVQHRTPCSTSININEFEIARRTSTTSVEGDAVSVLWSAIGSNMANAMGVDFRHASICDDELTLAAAELVLIGVGTAEVLTPARSAPSQATEEVLGNILMDIIESEEEEDSQDVQDVEIVYAGQRR